MAGRFTADFEWQAENGVPQPSFGALSTTLDPVASDFISSET